MAPTIHVIRHGQAAHNESLSTTIHDPELSKLGHEQCKALAAVIEKMGVPINMVLTSPLIRATQTALEGFESFTKNGGVIIPLAELQTITANRCDIGSPVEELKRKFEGEPLNYDLVDDDWTDKGPGSRFAPENVPLRAQAARGVIRQVCRPWHDKDYHVAVVSHGGFIRALVPNNGTKFKNTEMRSYQFKSMFGDDVLDAVLVETPESIARRGGEQQPATAAPAP